MESELEERMKRKTNLIIFGLEEDTTEKDAGIKKHRAGIETILDGLPLVVGLVYGSPGSTQENNDKLLSLLSKATEQQRSNLIIMGDFNFPTINWKQDYNKIREDLQAVDWNKELGEKPIEDMWKTFRCKLEKITVASTPRTTEGRHQRNKWMDRGTLTSVREKHQLFRKWQQTKDGLDYTAYIKARNKAAKDCRQAKKRLEKTVAADYYNKIREDLQAVDWNKELGEKPIEDMWKTFRCKLEKITVASTPRTTEGRHQRNKWMTEHLNINIGDLKKEDGTRTSSDQEKAETLNTFFQSVFTCEDKDHMPNPPSYTYDHALEDIEIREDCTKLLKSLNIKKAAGSDGITPLLLVETADALTQPITLIFRKSLASGRISQD
ncbi:hypothetical protein EGW08_022450 [Elysia chlorotica]|uniref:Uncharacterized protein n=1 Tax=Elysia chlorotica TaxID=188477 RepID=A0A433SKZ0_ELYCH|nr:hypothetical protein EGW08_022450 [Elysia chlorotica]